jgi:hypothetical protein
MQASVVALLALAQRQATFWWKPHDTRDNTTTVEQTAALLASKGVTELIIYCQMFLGANATLHFNTSSHGGGSRALCGPAFRATKAHGMRAQLIFGNQQTKDDTSKSLRNATWVAQASAAPAKIAAALRSVIDDISHEAGGGAVVDGINFDFEPWPHSRDARTGDAYSTLLSTVGDLLPQDVSVCVNNWTALFSNYSQMAAAASGGIYDMSTYHAPSLGEFDVALGRATAPLVATATLGKLASGLAQYSTFAWENRTSSVAQRFAALRGAGVSHVAMFNYPETGAQPPRELTYCALFPSARCASVSPALACPLRAQAHRGRRARRCARRGGTQ